MDDACNVARCGFIPGVVGAVPGGPRMLNDRGRPFVQDVKSQPMRKAS
jgi:hypothetical protein